MTADELFERGYSLEYSMWGVYVHRYEGEDHRGTTTVHFFEPTSAEEAIRRGWEAAETDFVKRRLAGET